MNYSILILIFYSALMSLSAGEKDREFLVSSIGDWTNSDLFYETPKGKMQKLALQNMGYSKAYPFTNSDIKVYHKEESGEYRAVLSLTVDKTYKKPFIVFFGGKTKIEYQVFDVDRSVFDYGGLRVYNGTNRKISVKLDEKVETVTENTFTSFEAINSDKKTAWFRVEEKDKLAFSSMIMRRKTKRMFMFVTESTDTNGRSKISISSLVDFL